MKIFSDSWCQHGHVCSDRIHAVCEANKPMNRVTASRAWRCLVCLACWCSCTSLIAQSVCLPAPRLLTTMPMGGQVGSEVEITITGQHLEDADRASFFGPQDHCD